MKYLKRFNESNYEDIKDFCEGHLVFLMDKGYDIKVVETNKNTFNISIQYEYGRDEQKKEIRWIEIKDRFIPFYTIL